MKQTVSAQLDDLQNRISSLKTTVANAQRETAEQVEARVSKAQADAQATQEQVAADASDSWSALKRDMKQRMSAVHTRVQTRKRQADAKMAEMDADGAEADAAEALEFAKWAIDNAGVTVLNAVKVRLWATGQAAKV